MPVELPSNFDADAYERLFPPGIERDFWHGARCAMVEQALRRHGLERGLVRGQGQQAAPAQVVKDLARHGRLSIGKAPSVLSSATDVPPPGAARRLPSSRPTA